MDNHLNHRKASYGPFDQSDHLDGVSDINPNPIASLSHK
jgi:hypothetical protein